MKKQKPKEHEISVSLTKVVQEADYEPFTIFLHEKMVFSGEIKNSKKRRRIIYDRLEVEIDNLIDERLDSLED